MRQNMKMSFSEEAEALRLYFAEHWKIGTISTHLRRHHSAVKRVVKNKELNILSTTSRNKKSILDDYENFIQETLRKYPNIPCSRIYQMLKERGYPGKSCGLVHIRIRLLRPKKPREAFLRLKTLPGEEGQVDWAHFGKVKVGKAERNLSAFVLTLSHSRMIYLRFFYSQGMREFLQGFVEAFEFFGGVPRRILLDNLKSGVTDRIGTFINYNEQFLSLSKHYFFEPCAVGVRKGNEKGRVERSIQYIRSNFFSGREFETIEKLNEQALYWSKNTSSQRAWQSDPEKKVLEAFEEEKSKLISLPNNPFLPYDRKIVSIGKTPYARYDLNDYSVPAEYVMKKLELCSSENYIEIFMGDKKIAEHLRSYSKAEVIENSAHIASILKTKKRALQGSALNRIITLVPDAEFFLEILAKRGENMGSVTQSLLKMLDTYGKELLCEAIQEVVIQETPKLRSLHFSLQRLESKNKNGVNNKIYIEIKSEKFSNLMVNHRDTSHYDKLIGIKNEK